MRSATLAEQQESLRRVAALVATGARSADVFAAIAREVGQMLRPLMVQIFRWERDGRGHVGRRAESVPRVAALGGRLAIDSPRGRGTLLAVQLPLAG